MKKRYVGKGSDSLASGRVVFPGDIVDATAKEWAENAHLDEKFIDAEPPKAASKKSDKE